MALVYRLSGERAGSMTYARFNGLLQRAAKIRRIEAGQPPTEEETRAELENA